MVLGRLPLSVHFMATVVSQLMTLNLRVGGEVKFKSLSFYCRLISPSSSWFSHVHLVHNVSFGGTRVSQKKRQLMRSVCGRRGAVVALPNMGFTVSHFNDAYSST